MTEIQKNELMEFDLQARWLTTVVLLIAVALFPSLESFIVFFLGVAGIWGSRADFKRKIVNIGL